MHDYFRHHMSFFNTLGCEHPYQMNDLLRECEKEMGGPPGDGKHCLTLKRDGQLFPVQWLVLAGFTTQLIDARDTEKAEKQGTRSTKTRIGMKAAKFANKKLMASADTDRVRHISNRHEDALKALHWGGSLSDVVRDLSLRCDTAGRFANMPEDDLLVPCIDEPEVEEFRLSPPETARDTGKTARGLRWVHEGNLTEIVLFEQGERAAALEKMRTFKIRQLNKAAKQSAKLGNATSGDQ